MMLCMILTIGVRSTTEMLCRMNALKEVKDLEVKTRAWIADIVTDGKNMHDPPQWIKEVTAEEVETDDSAGPPEGSKHDDEISGEDMDISEEEEEGKVRAKKRNVSSRESLT